MSRKQRKSGPPASAGARVAPPPLPAVSALRVLPIPPQVLESLAREGTTLKGQPDLRATRIFLGGWLCLFGLIAALLFVAAVSLTDDGSNARGHEGVLMLLGAVIMALVGGGIWFLLRQFRHVGDAIFEVDAEGMRWGSPAAPRQVAWRHVRRAGPAGGCNVWTEFLTSEAIVKRLVFDHALPRADDRPVGLPLRLSLDMGRVFRFRNRAALMRAVLLRLATEPVPRLRFNADVFIDAGVDPRSWEPMHAPRRWTWATYTFVTLAMLAAAWAWPTAWDIGWMLVAFPIVLVLSAGSAAWFLSWRYPDLQGVFEFETAPGATP